MYRPSNLLRAVAPGRIQGNLGQSPLRKNSNSFIIAFDHTRSLDPEWSGSGLRFRFNKSINAFCGRRQRCL